MSWVVGRIGVGVSWVVWRRKINKLAIFMIVPVIQWFFHPNPFIAIQFPNKIKYRYPCPFCMRIVCVVRKRVVVSLDYVFKRTCDHVAM